MTLVPSWRLLQCIGEVEFHSLAPDFDVACVVDVLAVEPDGKGVVVAEDEPEVALQVVSREVDGAAHPDVAVRVVPTGADVAEVGRAEGSAARGPCGVVVVGALPIALRLFAGELGRPCLLVGHGDDGLQHLTLGTHPAVGGAIDAQQAFDGLLFVRPVAGGAVGQLVVGRPDGEVGVGNDQRVGG